MKKKKHFPLSLSICLIIKEYGVLLKNIISRIVSKKDGKYVSGINTKTDIMKKFREFDNNQQKSDILIEHYHIILKEISDYLENNMTEYKKLSEELNAIANKIATTFYNKKVILNDEVLYYDLYSYYNKHIPQLEKMEEKCKELEQMLKDAIIAKLLVMLIKKD